MVVEEVGEIVSIGISWEKYRGQKVMFAWGVNLI